ncbi:MAG: CPBP family intramembrane metalloprotease [Planctomycetes bacterium]|nr:CPBP family intramembrane metalloprotease [Planctomycetota bacterium]
MNEPIQEPPAEPDAASFRRVFLWTTWMLYGGGFAACLLFAWLVRGRSLSYLAGTVQSPETWRVGAIQTALGLAAGLAVVAAGWLSSRLLPWMRTLEREFETYLFWVRGWTDILTVAVLSALAEEAFFRGLLQPWLGLGWASFLFAACHPPLNSRLALWPVFAMAMGLLMGWLFEITGENLLAPTATHFLVNLLNLRLITARKPSGADTGTEFAKTSPPRSG